MKHLKLYENFGGTEIEDFVRKESYFELDSREDDAILFATRENGNVGNETPGQKDLTEAGRLKKLIEDKFKLRCEIEEVDEWVHLTVVLKEKQKKVSYTIFKHNKPLSDRGWGGFGESCKTPEELSQKITRWTKIEKKQADELVAKLDGMEYNDKNFSTEFVDLKLPSKAMGYDWTIRKET